MQTFEDETCMVIQLKTSFEEDPLSTWRGDNFTAGGGGRSDVKRGGQAIRHKREEKPTNSGAHGEECTCGTYNMLGFICNNRSRIGLSYKWCTRGESMGPACRFGSGSSTDLDTLLLQNVGWRSNVSKIIWPSDRNMTSKKEKKSQNVRCQFRVNLVTATHKSC